MSVIPGTIASESLTGGLNEDTITGDAGNDTISGSEGIDVAVYAGTSADYQLGYTSGKFVVTDINLGDGDEGTDQLGGIETLHFSNVDLRLAPVGEFRVNTTTAGAQNGAAVTQLSGGGFVVSWVSDGQDGSGLGIYAQLYDANGNASGSEFRLNATTSGDQDSVSLAALADGGFIAAWQSGDAAFEGVWYRRFDAAGTAATVNDIAVNTTTASSQFSPAVVALSNGNYAITWTSDNQDGSGFGIYSRVYDNAGGTVLGETRVNTATADNQLDPSIAALSGGGYVVTWTSFSQESGVGSQSGIYAQLFNNDGTTSGSEIHVNTYTTNYQTNPSVCGLSGGGFVVTWQSLGQDGNLDGIYAQVFNAAGATVGSEFIVNSTTTGAQQSPAITALSGGGFAIAWQSGGQDGSGYGIVARVFNATGAALGGEIAVNTSTSDDQKFASITGSADGGFVVSWQSNAQDGDFEGIYSRRFDANGVDVKPTVYGTSGSDTINIAGDGDLTAAGLGGDDTYVVNSAGDSIVEGAAAGTDTVRASVAWTLGAHVEHLVLTGSGGISGTGNTLANAITGNSGNNSLDGAAGNDTLNGGAGDDTLNGGADNDTASYAGAAGGVTVNLGTAGAQNTVGAGTDTLIGIENLIGSGFVDTLSGDAGDNVIEGGLGIDTLSYANAGAAVTVSLATAAQQNTVGAGLDTVSGFENLTGSNFNDTLAGDAGNNVIRGGAGNDTMAGGAGNDIYVINVVTDVISELSGEGIDEIQGSITYSLADTDGAGGNGGNVENLTLTGSGNIDATGNALDNVLTGNAGNNVLDGAGGADTASYAFAATGVTVNLGVSVQQNTVGAGLDTLVSIENLTGSKFNDTLIGNGGDNVLAGGAGTDTVSYANAAAGVTASLAVSGAQNTVGAGIDTLSSFEYLVGSNLNDTLGGNSLSNVIRGGAGSDTLSGGAGDDIYVVNVATDLVVELAGEGNDEIQAASSYSLVDTDGAGSNGGNVENLTLTGSGNFNGTGNALNNTIVANDGNNVLDGGNGTDTVSYANSLAGVTVSLEITTQQNTVGSGLDTLSQFENLIGTRYNDSLSGSAGNNVINGGAGIDTVSYAAAGTGVSVSLGITSNQNTIGAGIDRLVAIENLVGSGFDDTLGGGAGNNVLDGGAGNDTVSYDASLAGVTVSLAITTQQNTVGAGLDTLTGFEHMIGSKYGDVLTGNSGNNLIRTGAGNDTLSGGADGNDTLAGGAGADHFVFDTTPNVLTNLDRISDFVTAADKIVLDDDVFGGGGTINAGVSTALAGNQFESGAGVTTASAADTRIIYDTSTGNLYYDSDGLGGTAEVQFATLTNHPTLASSDFLIIA